MTIFSAQDEALMLEALSEAQMARDKGEVPAGAVLADSEGRVIARGHNRVITLCDPTAHAEILSIRAAAQITANYRLTGTSLYSTLEPCPMCLGAAFHARIGRLVFGAAEPRWGAAGSLCSLAGLPGLNHRLIIEGGLMADECAAIIRAFFQEKR